MVIFSKGSKIWPQPQEAAKTPPAPGQENADVVEVKIQNDQPVEVKNEVNFTSIPLIIEPEPSSWTSNQKVKKSTSTKIFLRNFLKKYYKRYFYLMMVTQLTMNLIIMTVIPGIMKDDRLYVSPPPTSDMALPQCSGILTASLLTPLVLIEWYSIEYKYHIHKGDLVGVGGLILVLLFDLTIDTAQLIIAHFKLIYLRNDYWKDTTDFHFNEMCQNTTSTLLTGEDQVVLFPKEAFAKDYVCCGGGNESGPILNGTFRCCSSTCECNLPSADNSICLNKFFDDISSIYIITYTVMILFLVVSLISTFSFMYYNSVKHPGKHSILNT